jgi:general secretion pathway protein D
LAVIDQPTKHIQFGVLVVETEKNGSLDFGISWKDISGTKVSLSELSTGINPAQVGGVPHLGQTAWPNAVLSASEMSLIFNFLRTDSKSVLTQNPVIVARNNERTKISSSTSEPIRSASSGVTTGAGINNQETIEYLDVGTTIEVIPQVMSADPKVGDGKNPSVKLTVVLSIKDIIGQKIIGNTEYPIVASRDYAYSVIVPNDYSLAVGGLQNTKSKEVESKVPLLGDIPLLGHLFKSTGSERITTNMIAFITPHIISIEDFERGGVEKLPTKSEAVKAAQTKQGIVGFIDFNDDAGNFVGERSYRVVPQEPPKALVGEHEIKEVPAQGTLPDVSIQPVASGSL